MPNKDVLNIKVAAKTIKDGKIMLSSIVSAIVRNVMIVNGCEVETLMCEEGKELLMGPERLAETLLSSSRADGFKLKKVLDDSSSVDDNMSVAFQCKDAFCGRVEFQCIDVGSVCDSLNIDALLLVLDDKSVLNGTVPSNVPTVIAVLSDTSHENPLAEITFGNYVTERIAHIVTNSVHSCY